MKIKKILALVTAFAMCMSMATTALAVDTTGGTSGEGDVEFVYNPNVFRVTLPTVAVNSEGTDIDTTYDFILDPLGAIKDTAGAGLDGVVTEDASVYFANWNDADANGVVDEGEISYSATSDAKEIINKSSFEITVTVKAEIDAADLTVAQSNVALVDAKGSGYTASTSAAELYLAVTAGSKTQAILAKTTTTGEGDAATTTYETTLTIDVANVDDAYEVKYEGGEYLYELRAGLDFTPATVGIKLTGQCNEAPAWADLKAFAPEVELTWSVAPSNGSGLTAEDTDLRADDYDPITTYTVTFNMNTEEVVGAAPAAQTVDPDGLATPPNAEDIPGVDGKTFGGWYTKPACGDDDEFSFDTPITGNITLYAKWNDVPANAAPSLTSEAEVEVTAETEDITITVDLGAGELGADAIKTVMYSCNGKTPADAVEKGRATIEGNTITFNSAFVKLLVDNNYNAAITISFVGSDTKLTVNVTVGTGD